MTATAKRIRLRQPQVEDCLPSEIPDFLRSIYLNRGIGTAGELDLGLKQLLHYKTLKGIDQAVALLADAIADDKHILIVGDFDADGATSTAVAMSALARFAAHNVSFLVPDRFLFGYGLTPAIVKLAAERQADLILTVDNGISSIAGVQAAKEAGMQVVVTDHHLPGNEMPVADAIVNPNQVGCDFPSKSLAGVGVIFYVMLALRAELKGRGRLDDTVTLSDLLDLVALGTVADLVPLDRNNRILVQQGLLRMRSGRARPGIAALAEVSSRELQRLSAMDLGFFLGPRLNAAGRLDDMSIGIECLLAADAVSARQMANRLHELNSQRRDMQTQMQAEAESALSSLLEIEELPYSLCIYDTDWHEGIVGLVASRIKERYHRPTIAFAPAGEPGVLKGSARSISGLHIRDALDVVAARHPHLLSKFGGHAMAAGMSLQAEHFDDFRKAFEEVVQSLVSEQDLDAIVESDGVLSDDCLTLAHAETLEAAGPWGQHYPQPVFHGEFRVREKKIVGEKHLKLKVTSGQGKRVLDAIAFNAAEFFGQIADRVTLAYRLDINEYMGRRSLQFIVEYIE